MKLKKSLKKKDTKQKKHLDKKNGGNKMKKYNGWSSFETWQANLHVGDQINAQEIYEENYEDLDDTKKRNRNYN